jgi:hypothetical protein
MVLLVKYQLNKIGKDYASLYRAIESLGSTMRDPNMHTAWFVSTTLSSQSAYDVVAPHIDANDRLFITRLHTGEYMGWINAAVGQWINSHV